MASEDRSVLGWTSFLVAIGALVIALLIPILDKDDAVSSAAGAALTVLDVELGALVITPDQLTATPGHIQIRVTNVDTQAHNLSIAGQKTKDLATGRVGGARPRCARRRLVRDAVRDRRSCGGGMTGALTSAAHPPARSTRPEPTMRRTRPRRGRLPARLRVVGGDGDGDDRTGDGVPRPDHQG